MSIVNTLILYVVVLYWKKLNRHLLTCVLKVPHLSNILDINEFSKVMKTMYLINTAFFICQYVQVSHNYVYYKTLSWKWYFQIYLEETWRRFWL